MPLFGINKTAYSYRAVVKMKTLFLRNVETHLLDYTVPEPGRPQLDDDDGGLSSSASLELFWIKVV
jgi:hypothetical protein